MEINLDIFHRLPNSYTLWYHNPNEDNWDISSYHEILTFQTIEEFWIMNKFITPNMIEKGMFFLMIDGIAPIWEDPKNKNGGVLSWKIENNKVYDFWIDSIIHYLSNQFITNFNTQNVINGICISPKKNANIIKIWLNDNMDYTQFHYGNNLKMASMKPIYKSHKNNIEKDQLKEHRHTYQEISRNSSYKKYN